MGHGVQNFAISLCPISLFETAVSVFLYFVYLVIYMYLLDFVTS